MQNSSMKIKFLITALFLTFFINTSNAQLFWNQAANFAGTTSSYVSVPNSSSINLTSSFTLEAWVNPSNVSGFSKGIISKGGSLGTALEYAIRIIPGGRVSLITNGASRLISKTTTTLPVNQWTHVSCVYNALSTFFGIYINGSLDTSALVASASPPSNTDSLFIGISGASTPFAGKLDEIRIWNKGLTTTEVRNYFRTSLTGNSGKYSNLVLSCTFQDDENSGSPFLLLDWTTNTNSMFNRGITAFDLSNRPSTSITINDCLELDGNGYAAGIDNAAISPSSRLTLEAWIYLRSDANSIIIHKGPAGGGAGTNYRLRIGDKKLAAAVNGDFGFVSDDTIPLNTWTHVAFTYYGPLGSYNFYINGVREAGGINDVGNISDGTDSLYIGGSSSLINFNGFIDEVKITTDVKFDEAINNAMYRSTEASNGGEAVYNFDGYNTSNTDTGPNLYFRSNAGFAHAGGANNKPQSPMNRCDALNFSKGFYLKTSDVRIPETGTSGVSEIDTLNVLYNTNITDINVYVSFNHTNERNVELILEAPNGTQLKLSDNNFTVQFANNFTTIFDDQADSSLNNNRYTTFAPRIKPFNNLNSAFSGTSSVGKWKLYANDQGVADTGMIYAWGIQFNNMTDKPYIVNTTALMQGFYNDVSNTLNQDTMRYYFRNTQMPYVIIDSAKAFLSTNGFAQIFPANISAGSGLYYLQLKHRNSVNTWSSNIIVLDALTYQAEYSFRDLKTKAFGNNMILVDSTPVSFAIYSGDIDQNDFVDLADINLTYNDAIIFVTGYNQTDVTGNNITDLTDLLIVYNNSTNFVKAELPPIFEPGDNSGDIENVKEKFTLDPELKSSIDNNTVLENENNNQNENSPVIPDRIIE